MAVCVKCGKQGLVWQYVNGALILYSRYAPHLCGAFRRQRAIRAFHMGLYGLGRKLKKAA